MAFFEQSCASCHGPLGMFFGEEFTANLDDAALSRVVREMVEGPGRSTLDTRSLDALIAFHRSLRERPTRPFVCVSSVDASDLHGEVTPGSSVTVMLGTAAIAATVDGSRWTAKLPTHRPDSQRVLIRATSEGGRAVTEIDATRSPYSHDR